MHRIVVLLGLLAVAAPRIALAQPLQDPAPSRPGMTTPPAIANQEYLFWLFWATQGARARAPTAAQVQQYFTNGSEAAAIPSSGPAAAYYHDGASVLAAPSGWGVPASPSASAPAPAASTSAASATASSRPAQGAPDASAPAPSLDGSATPRTPAIGRRATTYVPAQPGVEDAGEPPPEDAAVAAFGAPSAAPPAAALGTTTALPAPNVTAPSATAMQDSTPGETPEAQQLPALTIPTSPVRVIAAVAWSMVTLGVLATGTALLAWFGRRRRSAMAKKPA